MCKFVKPDSIGCSIASVLPCIVVVAVVVVVAAAVVAVVVDQSLLHRSVETIKQSIVKANGRKDKRNIKNKRNGIIVHQVTM
jgi:hypothetical protein